MTKKLDIYKIPVVWEMWGVVRVKASSLDEAKKLALSHEYGLPDGDYVDDSEQVDENALSTMEQENIIKEK